MNVRQAIFIPIFVVIVSVFVSSVPRVGTTGIIDPRALKPEHPGEVENGTTNKIVLTMLAASSYEYVMTLRNNSQISQSSVDVRVTFSIPTKPCEGDMCTDRDIHLLREASDHFYVAAILDNNDLSRTCRENPDFKNRFFYLNYTGFNPYEGQLDYNFTNLDEWYVYQVRYTCGIEEGLEVKIINQRNNSRVSWIIIGIIFGITVLLAIVGWSSQKCGSNATQQSESGSQPSPPQEFELNQYNRRENPPVDEDEPQQENPATRERNEPQSQPLQAVEPQKTEKTEDIEMTEFRQRSVSDVNNSGEGTSTQNLGTVSPNPSTSTEGSVEGYVNHALDLGESSESPTDSPDAALLRKSNDKEKAKTKKKNKKN